MSTAKRKIDKMTFINRIVAPQHTARARRYITTLLFLWTSPIRLRPVSELIIIGSGLIAKLAPLAAFIITIQVAVWMISPERAPNGLRVGLGFDEDPLLFHLVVVSAPVLVFLIGSAAQKLLDHLSIQVSRGTAYTLVEANLVGKLSNLENSGAELRKFFLDIRTDYQTIYRSVSGANNILISSATVTIAAAIGFQIAPYFVSILLGFLSILAAVFIAWRHGKTNQLLEKKQAVLQEEVENQKNIQKYLSRGPDPMTSKDKISRMRNFLANGIGGPNKLDDRFRADTNFASAFGPMIGVVVLLAFLARENEVTEERAAQLVMLVLVLRFCIGNLQAIITGMVGLTRDYARLARICHGDEIVVDELETTYADEGGS